MRRWCGIVVGLLVMAGCAGAPTDPVEALGAHARPVGDLAAFDDAVSDATVVGIGEATHNSRDFFVLKDRLFRHLVAEKGFTTFALEVSWDIGLQLDDYVRHGTGDPRQILAQDPTWNTEEYLDLVAWMRASNQRRPDSVRFMGNDMLYPSLTGTTFDRVADYLRASDPAHLPEFTALHDRLAAVGDVDAMQALPLAERSSIAEDADRIARLMRERPGADPWAVQHTRVIAQTTRMLAFDLDGADRHPEKAAPVMRHRDEAMAENTVWWQRQVGGKVLVSAHNGHIGYESGTPHEYPKIQGAFLRDRLGTAFVSVGLTFGRGSFNATDATGRWRRCTIGPAEPGSNEHVLDRVSDQDYLLDLRTVPDEAREWLGTKRPTTDIGGEYPDPRSSRAIALGRTFDVVIHLHRVDAATRLA